MYHVLVDCENVPLVDLAPFGATSVNFTLLLGAKQDNVSSEVLARLTAVAASLQIIRLASVGKNALDFALAYYLGQQSLVNPKAKFYIISKDTGYDPLINHLTSRKVHVERQEEFRALPFVRKAIMKPTPVPPVPPKPAPTATGPLFDQVLAHLIKTPNRPKRRKTLTNSLSASWRGKVATETMIHAVIDKLCGAGHLSFNDKDAITYHF